MKRLVRLTAVLFGIGLIGMVGQLEFIRHQRESNPILLYAASEDGQYYHQTVYAYGFGSKIQQRILPTYKSFDRVGWSPDGAWFYLTGSRNSEEYDTDTGEAWRVGRDKHQTQRLAGVIFHGGNMQWTPDGHWIVADYWTEQDKNEIFRTNPDGRIVEPLTTNFDRFATQPHVSADGEWIYFIGLTTDYQEQDIYRIPIGGGIPENLTDDLDGFAYVLVWPDTAGWLIAVTKTESDDWQLNRLDWVSHQWLPIYETILSRDSPQGEMISATHQLVLKTPETVVCLNLDTGEITWKFEGTGGVWLTPDSEWVVVQFIEPKLIRIRPDGTGYAEIENLPPIRYFMGILPDSHSLLYVDYDVEKPSLYKFEIVNSKLRRLWVDDEGITMVGWSPDSEWILIQDYEERIFALQVDSGTVQNVHLNIKPTNVLALLPPIDRTWSPAGLLIIGGGLVAGGLIRRRGKTKS